MASLLWSLIAIHASPQLSRYDEWTYIDYADAISHGRLPAPGDELGELARTAWSCRGMEGDIRGVTPPPCDRANEDASQWPFRGENYNAFHPPLYFAYAGAAGRIATALGADFVDGARLASGLLAAMGAAALFYALITWGIGRRLAAGATLAAISTPALAQASAIVHNDAVDLLAGAAALYLARRVCILAAMDEDHPAERHRAWRRLGRAAFGLSLAIGSVRTISLVALITVGAVAVLVPAWRRRGGAMVAGGVAAGAALAYLPWTALQRARTPDGYVPDISGLSTEPLSAGQIPHLLTTFVGARAPYGLTSPRTDYYLHPDLSSPVLQGWAWVLMIACYAAAIISLLLLLRRREMSPAARFIGAVILLGPLITSGIVQGRELATSGSFFRMLSGRYAITLAPLYYAGFALVARKYHAKWVGLTCGLAGYLALVSAPFLS
ncbi:MAG: hypothetical protein Q4P33_08380 [Flaviflexus sp.]|nr:hypothetical protein [Flaviflexus sp.]